MIRFQCPACRQVLKAPHRGAGQKVACARCGQRLLIPLPAPVPAPNKTVLGRPMPGPAASSVSRPVSRQQPTNSVQSVDPALLGLVKDAEVDGGGPGQPAYQP